MEWKPGIIFGAILLALSSVYAGGVHPPQSKSEAITVPPTVLHDFLRELHLGAYAVQFEKTPLGEIENKIGAGSIEASGDAATSMCRLCYSTPEQLVWLVSTEMSGPDNNLMQVYAEAISTSDPRRQMCPPIPSAFLPLSLEFGWLGSSEASIREVLGEPSGTRGDWLLFLFAGKQPGAYRGPGDAVSRTVDYDVTAYVEVRIENGKAIALEASHVTSY